MANAAGGANSTALYGMAQQQQMQNQQYGGYQQGMPQQGFQQGQSQQGQQAQPDGFVGQVGGQTQVNATADGEWVCGCGQHNTTKFCSNCGSKKPEAAGGFKCGLD